MLSERALGGGPGSLGPKRLLSLDGGGIRGVLTLEILGELEAQLKHRLAPGDDEWSLSSYFDYIGGTSTGAVIATCLALGWPVARIARLYEHMGPKMFRKSWISAPWNFYSSKPLKNQLLESLPSGLTLGSDDFRCLLMMVLKNRSTDSAWPVSNYAGATYNRRDIAVRAGRPSNLDLPVWQLVRASTAAPIFFPSERIRIKGRSSSRVYQFVDGGITPYNNPSLQLVSMATLDAYGLGWQTGCDELLLVSIGTGSRPAATKPVTKTVNLLRNLQLLPGELMNASAVQQDQLCRVLGHCTAAPALGDRELDYDQLSPTLDDDPLTGSRRVDLTGAVSPKLFTYVRYDALLTSEGLASLGLLYDEKTAAKVAKLSSVGHIDDLRAIGQAVATDVDLKHFGSHDPARIVP